MSTPHKNPSGPAPFTILAILGVFMLCTTALFSFMAYNLGQDWGTQGNLTNLILTPRASASATPPGFVATATPDPFESNYLPPTPEPWNGTDRVTMLVMGLDLRDWEESGEASRSDTMILLTIDPLTKTAGVLSIPRDLWANIPGFKANKINTAYYFGEAYKLPGGGPALAIATVEQTLGIPIDYYARVDFASFINFIDLIGGVKIDVPYAIKVDPLGNKPPRTLQPGVQVLPGDIALAYARNRYTPGGDFDRAARQQQIIMGIRNRFISGNTFRPILDNAEEIYAELAKGVRTNLPFEDALKLVLLAVQIPEENIKTGVINEKYVTFGTSPDYLSILIPLPDRIRLLRDEIFASSSPYSPFATGDLNSKVQQEGALIAVQNGTNSGGLETRTADYLLQFGALASASGAAEQAYSQTTIIDHTGNPYAVQLLVQTLRIQSSRVLIRYDANSAIDIDLKLGTDWANNNPLP